MPLIGFSLARTTNEWCSLLAISRTKGVHWVRKKDEKGWSSSICPSPIVYCIPTPVDSVRNNLQLFDGSGSTKKSWKMFLNPFCKHSIGFADPFSSPFIVILFASSDTKDGIGTHYWAFRHEIKMCARSWIMLTCIKSKFNSFSASWRNVHKCISINRRIGRSRAFCLLCLSLKGAAFDWANDEDENCCRIMNRIARLILLVRRSISISNDFCSSGSWEECFVSNLIQPFLRI